VGADIEQTSAGVLGKQHRQTNNKQGMPRSATKSLLYDYQPLVELRVVCRAEGGATWRRVVVQEDTTLLNLHRVLQFALKQVRCSASIGWRL